MGGGGGGGEAPFTAKTSPFFGENAFKAEFPDSDDGEDPDYVDADGGRDTPPKDNQDDAEADGKPDANDEERKRKAPLMPHDETLDANLSDPNRSDFEITNR